MSDDRELLQAFTQTQCQSAFAELVGRYTDLVYGSCLRQLRDRHAAEDVSQAVFLVLARRAADITPGTPLAGWLFNVARHCAANYRRMERRRKRYEMEAAMSNPTIQSAASVPSTIAEADGVHGVLGVLDEALAALSGKERQAVLLRFYGDKSLREVGVALGISEDAAAQRMSRALRHLRDWLGRRGVAMAEAGLAVALSTELSRAAPAGLAFTASNAALVPGGAPAAANALAQSVVSTLAWGKTQALVGAALTALILGGGMLVLNPITAGPSAAAPRPAAPASQPAVPATSPVAVVEGWTVNFGKLPAGTTKEHTFYIRNDGKGTLRITSWRVSADFVHASLPKTSVEPGQRLAVPVTATCLRGEQAHAVILQTNDPAHARVVLSVRWVGVDP